MNSNTKDVEARKEVEQEIEPMICEQTSRPPVRNWLADKAKTIVVLIVLLIALGVAVGIYYAVKDVGDCSKDSFTGMTYTNAAGKEIYLKYIVYTTDDSGSVESDYEDPTDYTPITARIKCKEEGGVLWGVIGGNEEWDAVWDKAVLNHWEYNDDQVHLNGNVSETCETLTCKKTEAGQGKGLKVTWPECEEGSKFCADRTYSRLKGAAMGDKGKCIVAEENGLWKAVDCDFEPGWVVCIKRGCSNPNG